MKLPDTTFGLRINASEPLTMHIDMNSCFATMEQQANPLLRGRPVVVAAYPSPRGCIVAPSIEAKQFGIKTGMMVQDGRALCPDIVVLTPDPPKYRDAHIRFKRIFLSYTDKVTPKSIDEAIIDFTGSQIIKHKSLVDVGYEIKKRVKEDIGEWVRVNVGIGTNRFLAKTAAGLHKPDGLDVIRDTDVLKIYKNLELTDLDGIAHRYEARLNAHGILTPMDFYNAELPLLKKQVFKSINGYYWYLRIRGHEVDAYDTKRRTFGHTYALKKRTNNPEYLSRLLMKLCEKCGRRLRRNDYYAEGIHVSCIYEDGTY
jgi:DNA polymerase IV